MTFIEMFKAFIFGIVEGITEWLPISSTGHLILLNEFVKLDTSAEFYSMFEVVIQLGAILAVVVIFWNQIFPFKKDVNPEKEGLLRHVDMGIMNLWLKIIVACLPAAIIGLTLDDLFEKWFYNPVSVALALIIFGMGFIVIENKHIQSRIKSLNALNGITALKIGLFQVLAAIFPGVSRSGATILGGLMLGVSRTVAAEFTFFLAIPVMFGASLLKLVKFGLSFTMAETVVLLVGMVTAFVVSLFVIRFLMDYIKKHDFKFFGYYRIVLGVLVLLYFFIVR